MPLAGIIVSMILEKSTLVLEVMTFPASTSRDCGEVYVALLLCRCLGLALPESQQRHDSSDR